MDSIERHENRYKRRVAKREEKSRRLESLYDNFETVFTYSNLYKSYKKSVKNVGWKASVQAYKALAPLNVYNTLQELLNGTFRSKGFYEFDLLERGKLRHIKSVEIRERVVQRCMCDYCLSPLVTRNFIYDNSASQKGKGITFAINRITKQLHQFYNTNNSNEGYILQYDFSKYFDTLSHKTVKKVVDKYIKDDKIKVLLNAFIDAFGDEGLGLGSQVSQILSLACADDIDHNFKEKQKARFYGRYMDDGYIISDNKEYLLKCRNILQNLCTELGIKLNTRKTHISKLSRGFKFLKIKYYLLDNGKVLKILNHSGTVRMRRKLKKFYLKVKQGIMKFRDVANSLQSWIGHTLRINAYKTRMSMIRLFMKTYKEYIVGGGIKECLKF